MDTPEQLLIEIKKCLAHGGEFGYFPFIPVGYYLIYPKGMSVSDEGEYVLVETKIVKVLFSRGLIEKDIERESSQRQCWYKLSPQETVVKRARTNRITRKREQLIEFIKLGVKTAKEMSIICGRTAKSISKMLNQMVKVNIIKKVKRGVYETLGSEQLAWDF
ncbi:MAG: hypothetical protein ABFS56_24895 [Pseudomonadota bacterium]